ncbi:Temptin [Mizuhopecten yessoensis]|uniref:Temptin n=1 Tax=Mizuhopecten yessoensis TaxID=6573 RepID=A0A210QB13_MIZYE|nr:Temptin [Mizuhopecten yessoensis]
MIWVSMFCALLGLSVAFPGYTQYIPNGHNVPSPCASGKHIWKGVGHDIAHGGGPRNLFGLDFASSAHVWTRDLCMADSDLDGVSNGVELGDPTCSWSVGETPEGQATGHPGICEPMNDPKCQSVNVNVVC